MSEQGGSVCSRDSIHEDARELDPEEMAQMERELAEDAQWKRIQKNTFTRWANEHLKVAQDRIEDLETDLSDGLRLIKLLQVLSGKVLPRHSKKPSFRSQKLENVSVALKFLDEQSIRIVNIDSTDIVDSKLKLILGLIWTLILHYSISIPMLESDGNLNGTDENLTPKQRLMNWIQNKLGDVPVKNFTSDWRDGKAVGALVDAIAPGLCPDWQQWQPTDAVKNATEAMGLADDWLDVRQLIKPEEMVSPDIDEQSMMTYLSQYPNARLKPGAPLRPKSNPNKFGPPRVRAHGLGVEPTGNVSERPTYFVIDTSVAGLGKVDVFLVNPLGEVESVDLANKDSVTYVASYTPRSDGPYQVHVRFAGVEIPNSPFKVNVDRNVQLRNSRPVSQAPPSNPTWDPMKVVVGGRGLQPNGVRVGDTADIQIYTDGCGEGVPEVLIIRPGGDTIAPTLLKKNNGKYETLYRPAKEGRYIVMIKFAGQELPKSPYEVNVGPAKESKIRAYGPGLTGGCVDQPALFTVETNDETGALGFTIKGPSQARIDCTDNHNRSADIRYYPTAPGEYAVHIFCDDEDIPQSPFIAHIQPRISARPDRVEVSGPGVEPTGVKVGPPTQFTVHTKNAGDAPIEVTVLDPNYAPIPVSVHDQKNGNFTCSYQPKLSGKHVVQVSYGGVAVPKSPFPVSVGGDSKNVKVYGPGVEPGVISNQPTFFKIDGTKSGKGDVKLGFFSAQNEEVKLKVEEISDRLYDVQYTPPHPGVYQLFVHYGGEEIPQSPIKVKVQPVDVSKIKVLGLEKAVTINTPQQFRVVTQGVGPGEFGVAITSPSGAHVQAKVMPTHGGYLVNFTPTELGEYLLGLSFCGTPLTPKPYRVQCTQGYDSSKVRAMGPGLTRGIARQPAEFMIDTRGAGQGDLGVTVEGPCEAAINCRDNGDGTCSVAYLPTEPGDYTVNITFNDEHIQDSPFQAVISPDVDVSKIRVSGNGIQPHGLKAGCPTDFWVMASALSHRDDKMVTCQITNPAGRTIKNDVVPYVDGSYKVCYTPFEEGRHVIDIFYDKIPLPGSPFVVNVEKPKQKKCKVHGPGLEKGIVGKPNNITLTQEGAPPGRLEIVMEGPTEPRLTCKDNHDGTVNIAYIPDAPGEYDLVIKYGGESIEGSPFLIPVVDENKGVAVAYGPGLDSDKVRENVPTQFYIQAHEPGEATVHFENKKGPLPQKPQVLDKGNGFYSVSYVPPEAGSDLTIHVKHCGEHIPSSPFYVKVLPEVEPSKVIMEGPALKNAIPASIPTHFVIDASTAGYADLQVQVLGPDGMPRKVTINDLGDGVFKACFTPDDCGRYTVNVKYGNENVPNSPAKVQAVATGAAEKCEITEGITRNIVSGEEYCITVNTKNAGYGAVTCKIRSTSGSDVDIDIEDNDDGTCTIYYTVQDAGDYTIQIKFGGQPVPNGVYTFTVNQEETAHRSSNRSSRSSRQRKFREIQLHNIPLPSTGGQAIAEVKMPTGNVDKPVIQDNRDGTVSISYDPKEEGLHELYIKYNGENVQGSPFKFHVDSISSGYVTAYGPGLSHGVCGEPANFTISTKGAGSGGLKMAVEGPSKADISCHDNKDGTVAVTYLPTAPGEYKISVTFSDKHIKGSPFSAKITEGITINTYTAIRFSCLGFRPWLFGEGRKRNQISVASCSEVSLPSKVTESEIRTFNASIVTPSGMEEPCYLKLLSNGNLCVSFTPRMSGEHQVSVKKMGKHIKNSPFKINVKDLEVGDARKVKVSGALQEGKTHVENYFIVDTRNAGFGGLSLSIEGPSKTEINCSDLDDGTLKIGYKPTEPGYYIVNLKFADHHVAGSPFTVKITGEGSNRVREKIQRQREAVPVTEVGSQCKLTFKMPGITSFDLTATVTSPGGVTEDAEINEVEDGLYAVHFVPKELGVHTVSVKYKEIHIPGSPFQFTVGPLKDSGAHRVHAGGPGLERGEQGQPCEFNVWTREAGAGSLAISVEGPSKAEIDYKDRKDGSCYVSYVVSEPGEYRIGIKFNDQHIPDSPYKVYIAPAVGDAHKLEVAQFPETGVKADQPSTFLVRKNGAKGELDGKMTSHTGVEDDCFIQAIDSDTYSVRFMPRENGIHNIHLKFNGVHIPGSPFRIKVGKEDADPAAVHASGPGLSEIKTGAKTDFIVDTCNAGAGTLGVTVDGPSKVAMDCSEVEEGYKVRYTPLSPGDYYISVKYNGYHIVGSPFKVSCIGDDLAESGAQETSSVVVETVHKVSKNNKQGPILPLFKSDASKVTSKGMGLKKAYLQKQNMFTVHCGEAGNNILFVGIYGPKGPCEEVYIKHMGRNNYQVNYVVRERGEYIVIVRWGDEHIPGSPFKVDV